MQAINVNNPNVQVGAEHIAAENLALWGRSGILPIYDRMAATVLNGELIVNSGIYSNQGYEVIIPNGETQSYPIVTQGVGIKRYDILVSELSRDGEGVENHVLKIVSGTAAISPTKPSLIQGDFTGGDDLRQEAIVTLLVDGANILVESVASTLSISGSAPHTTYVQSSQPPSPVSGDLWFW